MSTVSKAIIILKLGLFYALKVGGSAPETVQILIKAMKNSEVIKGYCCFINPLGKNYVMSKEELL